MQGPPPSPTGGARATGWRFCCNSSASGASAEIGIVGRRPWKAIYTYPLSGMLVLPQIPELRTPSIHSYVHPYPSGNLWPFY
eukprot:8369508-Pyramimonas_sp.AAC.1